MKSIQRYLFIPKLFFLFSGMFILGAQLGKLHATLCDTTPVSVSSESASWGLSFQTEGVHTMLIMQTIPMRKKFISHLTADTKTEIHHLYSMP